MKNKKILLLMIILIIIIFFELIFILILNNLSKSKAFRNNDSKSLSSKLTNKINNISPTPVCNLNIKDRPENPLIKNYIIDNLAITLSRMKSKFNQKVTLNVETIGYVNYFEKIPTEDRYLLRLTDDNGEEIGFFSFSDEDFNKFNIERNKKIKFLSIYDLINENNKSFILESYE